MFAPKTLDLSMPCPNCGAVVEIPPVPVTAELVQTFATQPFIRLVVGDIPPVTHTCSMPDAEVGP